MTDLLRGINLAVDAINIGIREIIGDSVRAYSLIPLKLES